MKLKNKMICSLLFLMAIFFVSAIQASDAVLAASNNHDASNNNENEVAIKMTDWKKPIMVKKSQPIFTIILKSNPTTGFSWALKSFDRDLIRPISRKYYPAQVPKGLVGAGGYEKWTFAVTPDGFIVPQATSITLIYMRPWELESGQATNFKVVTINDN